MKSIRLLLSMLLSLGLGMTTSSASADAAPPSPQAVEFFEKRVRPILAGNCYSCHGEKRQKAGLRLDGRAAFLKGSDAGPVVVPGDPERSLLIRAVRRSGEIQMPPDVELPPETIETLTTWVKMGAPWPETPDNEGPRSTAVTVAEARKSHWAFQPIRKPELPPVKGPAWTENPIDSFILSKLEQNGMSPAPAADKRTLLRRVTFDLTGLPPTPQESTDFESDASPEAFARVVDRLLASPRYGERWGRHWLDVARYADTRGYVFEEERRYPYAYTYRDYVIRAFNDDLPYDQFVLHQLAADSLPSGEDKGPLAAMGYLTLGRRFLNNPHDIIDDRIDVVMRGLQGLTVTCARCHDHKFDPIPTRDYYSLYGVFASSVEPKDLPMLGTPERSEAYLAFEKELQAREQKLAEFLTDKHAELLARLRARVGDYLLAAHDEEKPGEEPSAEALAAGELSRAMVRRWRNFLNETRKSHDPILAPWHAFAAISPKDFTAQAPALAMQVAANADLHKRYHPLIAQAFADKPPASLREVAQRYGAVLGATDKLWQEAQQGAKDQKTTAPTALADADQEALRQVLYGAGSPTNLAITDLERGLLDRKTRDQLTALRRRIEEWKATSLAAPPRAMVLEDLPVPQTPHVFLRGNPNNPGEPVARQFLEVLSGADRKPFQQGSGRRELAQAIASKNNPLTARVLVNRLWLHHFGAGLVRTPSDFGLRGESPTHPELLDYLAATFMENGWSIKKLHRLILLSRTYQQSSTGNPAYSQKDPENRLLWKMNRHRLEFEELRDALLMVAGRLDQQVGGPAVDLTRAAFPTRRTIYGFIDRQNLPSLFRTFDFASPDTSSPQRYTTTVPQQALFLMNSPFVVEQAHQLLNRSEVAAQEQPVDRVAQLYRLLYGRDPEKGEAELGRRFLEAAEKETAGALTAWERYAQVLLLANEFAFVD